MGKEQDNGLTPIDREIIGQLQIDGRMPFSSIAMRLGISQGTIQRRTQQLIEQGYFKVIGVVDPLRSAQGQAVMIGLSVETASIYSVAATVAAIPEARFVSLVTGAFDVVCEIVAFDRATLLDILTCQLSAIEGIRSVNTSWVLANYYLWNHEQVGSGIPCADVNGSVAELESNAPPQGDDLQLDDLDEAIVRILRQDGRISYSDLAKETGATTSTVRRRMLRLQEPGYLKVVAVGNPFRLGFQDAAMLWIKVDLARVEDVLEGLAREAAVTYLSRVAGVWDIVAGVLFSDSAALATFLDGPLASLPGIRDVAVSIELTFTKRAYVQFN